MVSHRGIGSHLSVMTARASAWQRGRNGRRKNKKTGAASSRVLSLCRCMQAHLLLLNGFPEKLRHVQQPLQASRSKVRAVMVEGGQVEEVYEGPERKERGT